MSRYRVARKQLPLPLYNSAYAWYNSNMGMSIGAFTAIVQANKKRQMEENGAIDPPQQYPIYHNVFLWLFFGWVVLWIPAVHYSISSKHRWYFFSKNERAVIRQFFHQLFHRQPTADVKAKATSDTIAKLKRWQQKGTIVGKIHYTDPDGTEMTFKSADDLEAYLKSQGAI